jgi:hypothetical protein
MNVAMTYWQTFLALGPGVQTVIFGYLIMIVITAGHVWRHGRKRIARRIIQLIACLLWPIYWIFVFGLIGTIELIVKSAIALIAVFYSGIEAVVAGFFRTLAAILASVEKPIVALWSVGTVFFPAYYLATQWKTCSTPWCGYVFGKALIWAPFWPVYFATG